VNQVIAIALNTFRETIRDRVLTVIVLFALVMIVAGLWLGSISLDQQGRMMTDFGLVAVTAFGVIVAAFIAATLVRKEIEKRTVFILFSKPVSRGAFIVGKFAGLAATLAVVIGGMGLFLFVVTLLVGGGASGMILVATALIYLQVLTVVAVVVFFSTVTSAILASMLGLGVFVAGQLSHNVLSLSRIGANAVTEVASWVVFVVIPNLNAVDVKAAAVGEMSVDWGNVALWAGYLVAYMTVALGAASVAMRRKEF
jgi:ABC-type transport system involved in multi-copper enzyme maturation permease subunit